MKVHIPLNKNHKSIYLSITNYIALSVQWDLEYADSIKEGNINIGM